VHLLHDLVHTEMNGIQPIHVHFLEADDIDVVEFYGCHHSSPLEKKIIVDGKELTL